jgi:hypothetical protein
MMRLTLKSTAMNRYKYTALMMLVMATFFMACDDEQMASKPTAGFEIFKATSITGQPSDTIRLIPLADAGTIYVGDTVVFRSTCTGDQNYIFTGDTTYNSAGEHEDFRIAEVPYDVAYNPEDDQYVRVEALLFPSENQDLEDLYGYAHKKRYVDENGNYYSGIIRYVYEHAGNMNVVAYAVNYSDDGMEYSLDAARATLTIVEP